MDPPLSNPSWREEVSPYNVYRLLLLTLANLMLQINRFILAIVAKPVAQELQFGDKACLANQSFASELINGTDAEELCRNTGNVSTCLSLISSSGSPLCVYEYFGGGLYYQVLVGPVYIFVFTFSGILMGYLADRYNRKNLLSLFLTLWSIVIVLMAFVTQYWQLLILRMLLGFTQAGCVPFASSLIADLLSSSFRGAGIAFFEVGIYFGFSLAYVVGNLVTEADLFGLGWRPAFIVAGAPGILVALVISITFAEPLRRNDKTISSSEEVVTVEESIDWRMMGRLFCRPFLLVFFLASALRMGAGYCFAYNNQIYFNMIGESSTSVARWMSWIPATFGSIGCLVGGIISDRVAPKLGVIGRIGVIIASNLLASPFGSGVVFLKPPYCYLSLIGNYVLGETFIGVCITIVVELFPSSMRALAVGVYIFLIQNIGGNMEMFIPPLRYHLESTYPAMNTLKGLQISLFVMYPGMYITAAALYVIVILMLYCGGPIRLRNFSRENASSDPLGQSASELIESSRSNEDQINNNINNNGQDQDGSGAGRACSLSRQIISEDPKK